MNIRGGELLGSIAGRDILIFGIDLDPSDPRVAGLRSIFPEARFVTLTDRPGDHGFERAARAPLPALMALNRRRARAVIAVQDYRKLRALSLLVPARTRLVLRNGELARIDAVAVGRGELSRLRAKLFPPANEAALARDLRPPRGIGNDYGFIEERARLPHGWPRLRVSVVAAGFDQLGEQSYPNRLIELVPHAGAASGEVILWLGDSTARPGLIEAHLRWFHAARDARVVAVASRDSLKKEHAPYLLAGRGPISFTRDLAMKAGALDADRVELAHRLYRRGAYFVPVADGAGQLARDSLAPCSPKVSVYVPAHNAAPWIERTVKSALAQTLTDLEVCICDDGSTDDTVRTVQDLFGGDPRVRLRTQSNRGIGAASNAAVGMCRGEYILQLDSDDELLPEAAAVLAAELDADPELSLVYGGFEPCDPSETLYRPREVLPPPYDAFAHLHGNVAIHPRMFRARDFHRTEGFDETLENAVDFDIYLKLAEVGRVKAVPRVLYRYYIHGQNTSVARRTAQLRNHIKVVEAALRRRGLHWVVTRPDPKNERKIVFARRHPFLHRWL